MNFKEFYRRALYYLTVPKCVCCDEILDLDDRALCKNCIKDYQNIKQSNCSLCSFVMSRCICSNAYLESHFVKRLVKVFRYKSPNGPNDRIAANELIYNIKRDLRRDILDFLTDELIDALSASIDYNGFVVTNVPRKRSRTLKYGHDHSECIARQLADKLGLEYVKLLVSNSAKPQKKTRGAERLRNAKFDYVKTPADIKGKRVLLVDDIITTGASVGNCATLIHGLGAKEIVGVAVSVAYRDKYVPFAKDPFK